MTLRRNYDQTIGEHPINRSVGESSKQEYQVLLEFDLKREKEKNLILEERLRNKEVFIQQMKHFQEQVTAAYEQCKNELILAQEKIEYLQNVEFRDYTQQIADLKHMLIAKSHHSSKRQSLSKQERGVFSSLNNKTLKDANNKRHPSKNSDRRDSKNPSNINSRRQQSAQKMEEDLRSEFKKVSNFVTHFLQMSQCYLTELQREQKISKKLKKSWKWIKDVVKEWDQQGQELKKYDHFKGELAQLFKANSDVSIPILLELIRQAHH